MSLERLIKLLEFEGYTHIEPISNGTKCNAFKDHMKFIGLQLLEDVPKGRLWKPQIMPSNIVCEGRIENRRFVPSGGFRLKVHFSVSEGKIKCHMQKSHAKKTFCVTTDIEKVTCLNCQTLLESDKQNTVNNA